MSRPTKHPKTGVYRFRRAIPEDLRRLLGRTEFIETLGTKDPAEARRKYPAVAAKYDAIIAQARSGAPITLSHQQAVALAGDWYKRKLEEDQKNPGDAEGLSDLAGDYNTILEEEPSEGRKIVSSEVDAVLRNTGLLVDTESKDKLADVTFEM